MHVTLRTNRVRHGIDRIDRWASPGDRRQPRQSWLPATQSIASIDAGSRAGKQGRPPMHASHAGHARQAKIDRPFSNGCLWPCVRAWTAQVASSFAPSSFFLPFFLFLCPHVGVFWPNQISPITTFCGLFFLYLFLVNKYLLILPINKSLIIFRNNSVTLRNNFHKSWNYLSVDER
jgi:hypothetical protein